LTLLIDLPFSGIEPWVAYFKDVDLPVLRRTAQQLDELRVDIDGINVRKLAGIVLHDPLMTLRVFRYMEERRGKRQITDLTTIEQAIMMTGIYPFFEHFKDLPVMEQQLKAHPKAMLGMLKVFARTRHAADWARDWATLRRDLSIDEITVAALLHDFAEILMWCFAPALAIRVKERQMADHSLRSIDAQVAEYGVALYQVKLELAKAWGLPQLLLNLMDPDNADSPRVRTVKLAVDLARHTANGWADAALPDDFRAIEDLLHIAHSSLLQRVDAPKELILAARAAEAAEETSGS
jgi:HD-like signal output (HDOD) protein